MHRYSQACLHTYIYTHNFKKRHTHKRGAHLQGTNSRSEQVKPKQCHSKPSRLSRQLTAWFRGSFVAWRGYALSRHVPSSLGAWPQSGALQRRVCIHVHIHIHEYMRSLDTYLHHWEPVLYTLEKSFYIHLYAHTHIHTCTNTYMRFLNTCFQHWEPGDSVM